MKDRIVFVCLGLMLIGVFVLDRFIIPGHISLATPYAVPLLIAAYVLSPRLVIGLAVGAVSLQLVGMWIDQQASVWIWAVSPGALGMVGYLSAILAAKTRREKELAAESAEARQGLQEFLSLVAHELRGPLATIMGYSQLLDRQNALAEGSRQKALRAIVSQTMHLDRMVADLLDASRIGSGRFEVHPGQTDLVALAREVVEAQRTTSERHYLKLEAPQEPLVGPWDYQRVEQALMNLVNNAIKYSPHGGEVDISIQRTRVEAVVSISDHGIGMDPKDLAHLFEPYSRAYQGSAIKGTGLGLYLTKGIIQAHGGRIWVHSTVGKGSTFNFSLPLLDESAA